jgi:flagellum-specific peptidoglycan hydrolase FlgJ
MIAVILVGLPSVSSAGVSPEQSAVPSSVAGAVSPVLVEAAPAVLVPEVPWSTKVEQRLADIEELPSASDRIAAADALLAAMPRPADRPDDAVVVEDLARQVVFVRNDALMEVAPLPDDKHGAFVGGIVDQAVYSDWAYGVPASITVAQAILESGWGRAAPGNNLFGMKGEGTAGSTSVSSYEYQGGRRYESSARLRAYHSPAESVADHAQVLLGPRYARAMAAADDTAAFARALTGVYATDPQYHTKLLSLVDSADLARFDWRPPSGSAPWTASVMGTAPPT